MIVFRIGRLARELGVHRNTVANWIRSGRLNARPLAGRRYAVASPAVESFCRDMGFSDDALACFQKIAESADRVLQPVRIPPQTQPPSSEVIMSNKPYGSVLVIGGGIAGIQASLDLANSGYFVHLVERSAGIGGVMAQLDKTYPTNDCAM